MKRICALICMLICFLPACSSENADYQNNTTPSDMASTKILDSNTYYKVFKTNDGQLGYDIYNLSGEVVLSEVADRPVTVSMVGDKIVDIAVNMGTGLTVHKYYGVDDDIFSDEYTYVLANTDNLVAYIEVPEENSMIDRVVVVRDIFDETLYYKEFSLDFSRVDTPVKEAEFSEDESYLSLTYISGESKERTYEELCLK